MISSTVGEWVSFINISYQIRVVEKSNVKILTGRVIEKNYEQVMMNLSTQM